MSKRLVYTKRATHPVAAVQLALDTAGFTYQKWGGEQTCKRNDWIVNNNGEVYTVDCDTFSRTYRQVSPAIYVKATPVWAELADKPGSILTKEGTTSYSAGDYIVFNQPDGRDGYAVTADKFSAMYELATAG